MVRMPVVAGMFYDSAEISLNEQIKRSFLSEFGPGELPGEQGKGEIIGAVSPHAGYAYSGPGAAYVYKEIAKHAMPDLFIMLGLSHSGYPSCISLQDWETPLGVVKTDKEFGELLIKNTRLRHNEEAHSQEHSIEVQLPFLQFIKKDIKIIPVIISHDTKYEDIAKGIVKTIKESNKRCCLIASSDFTHYGVNYGFFPFSTNTKENMYKMDKNAIKFIENLDADGFIDYIEKTGATICGSYPIAVLVEACKLLGGKEGKLLNYYTSGDISGDYSSAVGYGSIIFEKK